MKRFYDLKIGVKLVSSFIIVALIGAVIGAIGIFNLQKVDKADTALYEENTEGLAYMAKAALDFEDLRANTIYLGMNGKDKNNYMNGVQENYKSLNDNLAKYEKTVTTDEDRKELNNLKSLAANYKSVIDKITGLALSNQTDEAASVLQSEAGQIGKSIDSSFDKIVNINETQAKQRSDSNAATAKKAVMMMIIAIVIGIVASICYGIFLSRIISKPIQMLEDAANKISDGNLDVNLKINTKDEVGTLAQAFDKIIASLNYLINDTKKLTEAAVEGRLSTRAEASKHNGGYREIVEGLNNTLDAVVKPLNFAASYIQIMSDGGKLEFIKNDYKGDFAVLIDNLNSVRNSLVALLEESGKLAMAGANGELSVRGDANKLKGGYADIINGMNQTLDSVEQPLKEADQVLAKMAVNDYTVEMSDKYKGMFKELGDSINAVHGRLLSVEDVFVRVSKGDTSRLEEFRRVGKRSENDRLVPATISMMGAIQNLIDEANMLADAAVQGDLSVRGDAGKFEGGYREIIEGMNHTMDAVVEPIQEALEVMEELAQGDLTVTMDGDYKGEYSKLKDSLNTAINSFNDVLNGINSAASQVAAGSRQISDGSQELSQGTTEQASSIEELTASIEEIAAQTKQNAVNANQANELSVNAKENAIQGNEQMKQMQNSMSEINEASSNISKIIKVIDEIAFQTNILALNAAVEAARAGQHGKGFAVVAEEVRNLAARSANAAKETTELIEGSINKVQAGTKIANDTANALNIIVEEVNKVASLVGEIATASNEQATGVAQINKGIEQVSQVVQTNSATAEEAAAASEELSSQAELLKNMVDKFKLKKSAKNHNRYELSDSDDMLPEEAYKIQKKNIRGMGRKSSMAEVAATSVKPRIALSDKEFGKY